MAIVLSACWGMAHAQQVAISAADGAQINATVKQYYSLSHPDASCVFSKIDHNGQPVDPRVRNREFRLEAYTRIFKPLFSRSLFDKMRKSCVGDVKATGMLDARLWDSEIDSDPSNYGNEARLEITQPVRILQVNPSRVRVRIDWAEIVKGGASYYGIGRTDLILVKETGSWRIDDAYAFGAPSGSPKQFDMSIDDFNGLPGIVHLRQDASW
ncbi:hypothetical protein [Paraburkholderia ferrariae]|uniref:DUF3828 domain-containing protein n=1 Tax=Paraburkholderia ferrariae TaxID=386056 RepID=A0ABU9RWT0_9BURK